MKQASVNIWTGYLTLLLLDQEGRLFYTLPVHKFGVLRQFIQHFCTTKPQISSYPAAFAQICPKSGVYATKHAA
jgi:hypothetical protein